MRDTAIDTQLLEAALDCFGTFGIRKTSLTDVAEQAGVSRSTVYRVFGDKEGLVRSVLQSEVQRFLALHDATVPAGASLTETLRHTIAFTLTYLNEHRVFQRVVAREPEQLMEIVVQRPGQPSVIELIRPAAVDRLMSSGNADDLGVPIEQAAEWMVRAAVSMLLTPSSVLRDPADIATLIVNGIARVPVNGRESTSRWTDELSAAPRDGNG